jgi:hypothetical protein
MVGQHARRQRKTTIRRKGPMRGHKTSKSGQRRMSLEGKDQRSDTNVLLNGIEFLEVHVVGPLDAGLEAEESILGEIEEI